MTERTGETPVGWLAAIVPAHARRFSTDDGRLGEALTMAGAELVDDEPDVEIVRSEAALRGDAETAIVNIDPFLLPSSNRLTRAGRRVRASLSTRKRAARARAELRRRGYQDANVVLWDIRQRLRVPDVSARPPRLVERAPSRALVIGRRADKLQSALDATIADASCQVDREMHPTWISIRSGVLLAAVDGAMLRAAIGPGSVQIEGQAAALEHLGGARLPATLTERVPQLLARGRTGLVDWSLERRLRGATPQRRLGEPLAEECRAFLVALHRAPGGEGPGPSATALAEMVASVCAPEDARRARSLGTRLDDNLGAVPRGFGHGDFFAGNLLSVDDRLTGVLDWDAGGPGRLPVVDLLHLELTQAGYGTDEDWGPALLAHLLPVSRAGRDERLRRYCHDVGIDLHRSLLEALVASYWLSYVAYQLHTHPARRSQSRWIEQNVARVLREIARSDRSA